MKKISTLILLIHIAVFGFSQNRYATHHQSLYDVRSIHGFTEGKPVATDAQTRSLSRSGLINTNVYRPGKAVEYLWNDVLNRWELYDSIRFTYNLNGNPTVAVIFDSLGMNSVKRNYTYNSSGKLTDYTRQQWINSAWENTDNYIYLYDANNRRTQFIRRIWEPISGTWETSYKYDYLYDANDNVIQLFSYNWNIGTGSWDNALQADFSYAPTGELETEVYYNWNGTGWDLTDKFIDTWYQWVSFFSNDNKDGGYVNQTWNGAGWDNYYRGSFTYDANSNIVGGMYYTWQSNNWTPDDEFRHLYTYDVNFNITQDIEQWWDFSSSAFVNTWRIDYSNYQLFIGVKEINSLSWNVYPNPSSGFFTIEFSSSLQRPEIRIFNAVGKMVFENHENADAGGKLEVDCSLFSSGIYYLQLVDGDKVYSRKIIVTK